MSVFHDFIFYQTVKFRQNVNDLAATFFAVIAGRASTRLRGAMEWC